MTDIRLYTKIASLPDGLKSEVLDFIEFLEKKNENIEHPKKKSRTFGYAKDAIDIKPDFDEPLADFEEYM